MELKAKDCSLWGKIIGGLFIVICSIFRWIGWLPSATQGEICMVGGCIVGFFSTVDINLMLEKLCHIKKE